MIYYYYFLIIFYFLLLFAFITSFLFFFSYIYWRFIKLLFNLFFPSWPSFFWQFFLIIIICMYGCSSVESPPFDVSWQLTSGRATKAYVETAAILPTVENGGSNERPAIEDV